MNHSDVLDKRMLLLVVTCNSVCITVDFSANCSHVQRLSSADRNWAEKLKARGIYGSTITI
jgi:hypothetical protein